MNRHRVQVVFGDRRKHLKVKTVKPKEIRNEVLKLSSKIGSALTWMMILICAIVLISRIASCYERFMKKETKVIMAVKPSENVNFVAFSICPAYDSAYKVEILDKYGTNKAAYGEEGNYTTPNDVNKPPLEVFEEVTYSLQEILHNITFDTLSRKVPSVVIDTATEQKEKGLYGIWVTKYHPLFGKCFSLELEPTVTSLGIRKVTFVSLINMYVYIHHPGQYMDRDSNSKFETRQGEKLYLTANFEISIDTLEKDSQLPCSADMNHNFDDCLATKIPMELNDRIGCTVPYMPLSALNQTICDANDDVKMSAAFKKFDSYISNQQHLLCQRPCETTSVFIGQAHADQSRATYGSLGFAEVLFKTLIKEKYLVLDYTGVSMMAEIGGYTGLLFGLSLVDSFALIDSLRARFM